MIVVVSAVIVLTVIGSMAAFSRALPVPCQPPPVLHHFSAIIFPPQITIISMFQILVQYGLYNSLPGLTLVYIAIQLPLTVYILESFFARIPAICSTPHAWTAIRMGDLLEGDLPTHAGDLHHHHPELHPALE